MGGMHTWIWGEMYPDFMSALVPLASMPVEVAGRNWMMRRMLIDLIRNDPEWNGGSYTKQARSLPTALVYFGIAASGGTQALYKSVPTLERANQIVNASSCRHHPSPVRQAAMPAARRAA